MLNTVGSRRAAKLWRLRFAKHARVLVLGPLANSQNSSNSMHW